MEDMDELAVKSVKFRMGDYVAGLSCGDNIDKIYFGSQIATISDASDNKLLYLSMPVENVLGVTYHE